MGAGEHSLRYNSQPDCKIIYDQSGGQNALQIWQILCFCAQEKRCICQFLHYANECGFAKSDKSEGVPRHNYYSKYIFLIYFINSFMFRSTRSRSYQNCFVTLPAIWPRPGSSQNFQGLSQAICIFRKSSLS